VDLVFACGNGFRPLNRLFFPEIPGGRLWLVLGIQQPHMAIDRVPVQLQTPRTLPIRESLRVQLLNHLSVDHADLVRQRRLRRVEKHPAYDSRTPHHWPVFRRPLRAGFGCPLTRRLRYLHRHCGCFRLK